jgi:type II secretory pathway component PulC
MEARFIKDLALALIFICLFAFAVKDYTIYHKVDQIPQESKYTDISVNEDLINQIQDIESSIQDRKSFTFNVPTDPLRQDPVIKDKLDRLQAWESMVKNMVRVAATFINEDNQKVAIIAYQGKSSIYRIGDTIAGRHIDDINNGTVFYTYGGVRSSMTVQPIPPMPEDLEPGSDFTDYNY